jgi:hypothetical protein
MPRSFIRKPFHDCPCLGLPVIGNAWKAAELVRRTGKKSLYRVTLTGEMNKNTVKVDSIEAAGV